MGAPRQPLATDTGAVYIAMHGASWSVTQKLVAPDAAPGRRFGSSVAVEGSWAVVGSDGAGAAYVYQLVGSTWTYRQKLTPSPSTTGDFFGSSAAISGTTMMVGAYGSTSYAGRVFVFKYNGSSWIQSQILSAFDGANYDFFGFDVALSNNFMIVGAYGDDETTGTNFGSSHVFRFDGTQWLFHQKLQAPDGGSGDNFGESVDIDGDRMVIGASRDDDAGSNAGAAYIFALNGEQWSFGGKLTGSDSAPGDWFGTSVAINENLVVVGSPLWDGVDGVMNCGAVYPFAFDGTGWNEQSKLLPPAPWGSYDDNLGKSVAVSSVDIVGGANLADWQGRDTGDAYFFDVNCDGSVPTCVVNADCNDSNACTTDTCSGGACVFTNSTLACNDGLWCNGADSCSGGTCSVHAGNPCASGAACANTCNETADHCFTAANTACTADTNSCTNDVCNGSGLCTHPIKATGTACGSPSAGLCDNPDTCNASGVCMANNLANGTACTDDGIECTNDSCNSGLCTHPAKTDGTACTPDTNGCTSDACTAGTCAHPNKSAGSVCGSSASGLCDNPDTCNASGVCLANNLVNGTACADDGIECTSDTCSGGTCTHPIKLNGSACNDGNAATSNDQCSSGTCVGIPQCVTHTDCNDNNACTNDTCVSGACQRVNNTVACTDDGNACTNDVCSGGSCTHPNKPAGTACGSSGAGLCDNPDTCSASGVCLTNNLANGTTCTDDGNECTNDSCGNGLCTHPNKANNTACTADTNSCTNDICNGSGSCTHPNKAAGTACGSSSAGLCDNPDSCNASGACLANNLVNGTACTDDGNECTSDTCSGGTCTHPAKTNGTACTPDTNECTNDSCNNGQCAHLAKSNNTPCDDGNDCTETDSCLSGVCRGGPGVTCDDGDPCTTDTCMPLTGCFSDPIDCPDGQTCVDGVCTTGFCNNGVCDADEDSCNCPGDCLTVAALCGNGVCDAYAGEDCRLCPGDCRGRLTGPLSKQFCCGDDIGAKPAACESSTCNARGWVCTDAAPPCR